MKYFLHRTADYIPFTMSKLHSLFAMNLKHFTMNRLHFFYIEYTLFTMIILHSFYNENTAISLTNIMHLTINILYFTINILLALYIEHVRMFYMNIP